MEDDDPDYNTWHICRHRAGFGPRQRVNPASSTAVKLRKLADTAMTNGLECVRACGNSDEVIALRCETIDEILDAYFTVGDDLPPTAERLLVTLSDVVKSLPLDDPTVVFRMVVNVAHRARHTFGVAFVHAALEIVFRDVSCVNLHDDMVSPVWHVRSTAEVLMHCASPTPLRWLLQTEKLSVDFDRPMLYGLMLEDYIKVGVLASFRPDVFAQVELKTMYDDRDKRHSLIDVTAYCYPFDKRRGKTLKGTTLEIAKTLWGDTTIPGLHQYCQNRHRAFQILDTCANLQRLAQSFVCLKRTHCEAIIVIAEMVMVPLVPPYMSPNDHPFMSRLSEQEVTFPNAVARMYGRN